LDKLGLTYVSASIEDQLNEGEIRYEQIDEALLKEHLVVINATPLGTFPKVDTCPPIPYESLTADHVLFDLVYNPEETLFMKKGKEKGAAVKNGLEMLHGQAIKAWEIWNM
jgi:shikimate dehydrogenase